MKNQLRVVLTAAAALLVLAAAVLAAGEYSGPAGSENDPLVTMSYINDVFTPYVQRFFKEEMTAQTDSLRESLEERVVALEEACREADTADAGLSFREIRLDSGRELYCEAGTELLLRSGSAFATAEQTVGMVDTSGGTDPVRGEYLKKNHMYLVTEDGCGVCADGDITILIRGSFEIE